MSSDESNEQKHEIIPMRFQDVFQRATQVVLDLRLRFKLPVQCSNCKRIIAYDAHTRCIWSAGENHKSFSAGRIPIGGLSGGVANRGESDCQSFRSGA